MPKRPEWPDSWSRKPLPSFGELDSTTYEAWGLKVGLEIHQQLLTERKLFCRCPAGRYSPEHHAEILRHMRPTLSEMGEYDGTALMEFKTRKEIVYLLHDASVCTYEMDDAPPFELNQQALNQATALALLLGCQIVGEVHITRKQYLDGSIPTGFQRTTIIGTDGALPFRGRQIRIFQLGLEEDSCREVSDQGHVRTFRTDRLGMPLIEVVTGPDLRSPAEAAAVGQLLRRLTRGSGLVRTGPGAARQDVNVSVAGGTRIEIKGVASLRAVPRLVHNEALRQRSLLAIRDELGRRGITAAGIEDRSIDVTAIVRGTAYHNIKEAVERNARVQAVPLPGFEGLLGAPTQTRTTFLKEFSDRIRVIACLDDLPNLVCSTYQAPTLASGEWRKIARACAVKGGTPILVVWGPERDVQTASREITIRAREACLGVPAETRQALPDGTNGFERILPGPDRMYPDTDLPPVKLDDALLERIRTDLPEPPWRRQERLAGLGVGPDLAERLSRHPGYDLFRDLAERLDGNERLNPGSLASLLLDRRCSRPPDRADAGQWWRRTVDRILAGEIFPESVWSTSGEPPACLSPQAGREMFKALLVSLPGGGPAGSPQRENFVMGHVMHWLRGLVPGHTVRAWVREWLQEVPV